MSETPPLPDSGERRAGALLCRVCWPRHCLFPRHSPCWAALPHPQRLCSSWRRKPLHPGSLPAAALAVSVAASGAGMSLQWVNVLKFQGENKVHPHAATPPRHPPASSPPRAGGGGACGADLSLPAGAAVPGGHDGEGLLHHDRALAPSAGRQVRGPGRFGLRGFVG